MANSSSSSSTGRLGRTVSTSSPRKASSGEDLVNRLDAELEEIKNFCFSYYETFVFRTMTVRIVTPRPRARV